MVKAKLGITMGDPGGIGPEIITRFFYENNDNRYIPIIIGYKYIFEEACKILNIPFYFKVINNIEGTTDESVVYLLDLGGEKYVEFTKREKSIANAKLTLEVLEISHELSYSGKIDAIITLPINKSAIQQIKSDFEGHTEFFARESGLQPNDVVMILKNDYFKVALAVNHTPVREIASKINNKLLMKKMTVLSEFLTKFYGIDNLKIAVSGLNPHGNINGEMREEEINVIVPAIDKINNEKKRRIFYGPYSADTIISPKTIGMFDAFFMMYHDQGLPLLKFFSFGRGVNITAGLPYIRTSVDHGTANDIAWQGLTNVVKIDSLKAAIDEALYIYNFALPIPEPYDDLAEFYDDYMGDVPYNEWAAYIDFLIDKYSDVQEKPIKLLDIGCGTGSIEQELANIDKDKYQIIGIDKSKKMIEVARQKRIENSLFFTYSIEYFTNDDKFDVIISIFDTINYIKNKHDLELAFKNMHNLLSNNGLLIFDISTEVNSKVNFTDDLVYEEYDGFNYVGYSDYDDETKLQITELTIYKNIFDNFYKLEFESHEQRVYSIDEIVEMLHNIGFEIIEMLDVYTKKRYTSKSERIYFIGRKVEE